MLKETPIRVLFLLMSFFADLALGLIIGEFQGFKEAVYLPGNRFEIAIEALLEITRNQ